MSSPYQRLFPWQSVERGQGFFIPCLNLKEVQAAGLRQALLHRILDAHARPGIKDGRIGVWFYRGKAKN
jgi:hypothetical protein